MSDGGRRQIGGSHFKGKKMKQEYLDYLDNLRKSAITNMYGARPYLIKKYPELSKKQARQVLLYWMGNFNEKGTKIIWSGEFSRSG